MNHPPPGLSSKANARFLTVEGPNDRFIVMISTRHIYPNEEIYANYSLDYKGFETMSQKHELSTPELPDAEEFDVGEYVLIKGFTGEERQAEV